MVATFNRMYIFKVNVITSQVKVILIFMFLGFHLIISIFSRWKECLSFPSAPFSFTLVQANLIKKLFALLYGCLYLVSEGRLVIGRRQSWLPNGQ